jgi:hypothetical protein
MKYKLLNISMFLALFLSMIVSSCKDVFNLSATDEELNRSFMAVFRQTANTGNSADQYACKVVNTNDMYLSWNGINGAIGYRIQMKIQSGQWTIPADILLDTIVGPDVHNMTLTDLQYSTKHCFAIQTLSPKGETYNSKWYGKGDTGHSDDRCEYEMGVRLYEPYVVYVTDKTETSMRVWFDLNTDDWTGVTPAQRNSTTFQWNPTTKKFLIDQIKIEPASDNRELPTKIISLTPTDIANGYVDVAGLTSNAMYVVNGLNNLVARKWDKQYNTVMVRMRGAVGEPILIPHKVDTSAVAVQNNASRLDTILTNYITNNSLAEGTIFELEAGKTYYLGASPVLAKGLVLRSKDPNNKATVLMGLGWNSTNSTNANANNFLLGRAAASGEIGGITVGDVTFSDINFSSPLSYNYFTSQGTGKAIGANYFMNQNSASMPFTCNKLEVNNCSFQGMVRGWFRTQGSNRQNIDNIIINNCVFHDCGNYSSDGRGYSFINGDAKNNRTNIFKNVVIKNNSFIGISYDKLLHEQSNYDWIPGLEWHITIENNTFLNAFSIASGRYMLNMLYPPANSTFTIRKNLFVAVKKATDTRTFYLTGMNFSTYRSGVTFNVADNYTTSQKSASTTTTYWSGSEMFTLNPFSSTSKGAGYQGGIYNIPGGLSETILKTGATPIAPENLMVDPFPIGSKTGTATWANDSHKYNVPGLKFKSTSEVQNHEIYTKGIGDPRWR